MGSLRDRMMVVSQRLKKNRIPNEVMSEIGLVVIQEFVKIKPATHMINKQWDIGDDGVKYKAITYPKTFHRRIDEILTDWYKSQEPKKRERKRIAPGSVLVYTR